LIVDQLAAAGFEPRPLVQEPKVWQSSFAAGDFEAVVFELGGLATPDVGLRLHMTGGVDGRFSLWGYSNPVYDVAVRDALSALNPGERARKSRDAQRMLLNDVPAMFPIAAPVEQASIVNRLGGYEFDGYDFNAGWLSTAWELKAPGGRPTGDAALAPAATFQRAACIRGLSSPGSIDLSPRMQAARRSEPKCCVQRLVRARRFPRAIRLVEQLDRMAHLGAHAGAPHARLQLQRAARVRGADHARAGRRDVRASSPRARPPTSRAGRLSRARPSRSSGQASPSRGAAGQGWRRGCGAARRGCPARARGGRRPAP